MSILIVFFCSCVLRWFCLCCLCRLRILSIGSSESRECSRNSCGSPCAEVTVSFLLSSLLAVLCFLTFSHEFSECSKSSLLFPCLFGVCTRGGSDNGSCKGWKTPFAVPLNGSSGSLLESLSSSNCFIISSVSSRIQFVQTVVSPWLILSGLGKRVGSTKNLMFLFLRCASSCCRAMSIWCLTWSTLPKTALNLSSRSSLLYHPSIIMHFVSAYSETYIRAARILSLT